MYTAEESRWSVGSGRGAPGTAGTSFQTHDYRSFTHTGTQCETQMNITSCFLRAQVSVSLNCALPENGQVRRFHQHVHQRIHHLGVEDDGIHHFTKLLVISNTETGLGDAGVGLHKGKRTQIEHEEDTRQMKTSDNTKKWLPAT